MEKPLFIPLCAQFYDAFDDGSKDTEYRLYGARWNETTCRVGRAATLSRGYGKKHRSQRVVVGFKKIDARLLTDMRLVASIMAIYGTLSKPIAAIQLSPKGEPK